MSFDQLVRRQAGVVTLNQAVACGVSAATVQRRARQKAWERLHSAVYLVGGHRLTDVTVPRRSGPRASPGCGCDGVTSPPPTS